MHKKWCGSSVAAAFGIAAVALFGSGYARAQESAPPMPPLPPGSPGAPPISPVILTAPPIERGEGVVPAPRSIIRIGNAEYASDQVIVTFKSDITSEQLSQFARAHNLTSRFRSKILGYVFTLPEGTDVQQVVSRLKDHPLVRRVGMNGIGRGGSVTPTDQYYSSGAQWHLDKISMPQAWARTMGDWNYAIAVLDSGVQSAHPDLNSKLGRYPNGDLLGFNAISGVQYPDPGYYPEDDHGHGTAVIGVAGAATTFSGLPGSGNGVAGVSPNAPIVPVKVLNSNNFGLTPWIANGF